ncbi:MAG: hypothetical protein ACOC0X_00500 [Halobacteriota archaeon]
MTVPLSGRTAIVGPSGIGKTRLTARAFEAWVDRFGAAGTVALDFGPEVDVDGRTVGRRLDRFVPIPAEAWYGVLDAHGPRTEGSTPVAVAALARENAAGAERLLDAAPASPAAVFVNDVTIAAHHDRRVFERVLEYAALARCAVVNGYDGQDLGDDDPLTRRERVAIDHLIGWADRVVRPPVDDA